MSACFVAGFSAVFVALGASATALGGLLLDYRYELNIVGGALIIGFGVFMLGLLRPAWMLRDFRFHASLRGGHPLPAFLLGTAFAFGWTLCIGPTLAVILTLGATSETVAEGTTLLAIYSLGLGIPFLVTAAFTDALTARRKALGRAGRILNAAAGGVMIALGILMVTGKLHILSYWLLDAFPVLTALAR